MRKADRTEGALELAFTHGDRARAGTYGTWSPVADPGQLSSLCMRRIRNCTKTKVSPPVTGAGTGRPVLWAP